MTIIVSIDVQTKSVGELHLEPGGNDYPAKGVGVVSLRVRTPQDTKLMVTAIIAYLGGAE